MAGLLCAPLSAAGNSIKAAVAKIIVTFLILIIPCFKLQVRRLFFLSTILYFGFSAQFNFDASVSQ